MKRGLVAWAVAAISVGSLVSLGSLGWLASIASCGTPAAMPRDAGGDAAIDAPDAMIDGRAIDASPFDARPGLPDLELVADEMVDSALLTLDNFPDGGCEVAEHCVDAPGYRFVLRFATVSANRGTADMVVGVPPDAGVSDPTFEWSPCHMHHHVRDYATYELLDENSVVLTARKQSFCLEDSHPVQPGIRSSDYSCARQGITRGWADVYGPFLPCQFIDVTDVLPGTYTLRIRLNPLRRLVEGNYDNNELSFTVRR